METSSEPDFTRPNIYAVLVLLQQAGSQGMLAGDIVSAFAEPASRSARNRLVNAVGNRDGLRRPPARIWLSGDYERGDRYHGTWQHRWFITQAGLDYIAGGSPADRAARQKAARQAAKQAIADNRKRRVAVVQQAVADGYGTETPVCKRAVKIGVLRKEERLSLDDIGVVFGISRERVRQILQGREQPCRCPLHPEVPVLSRAPYSREWQRYWPRYARKPKPGTLGEAYFSWARETALEQEP